MSTTCNIVVYYDITILANVLLDVSFLCHSTALHWFVMRKRCCPEGYKTAPREEFIASTSL